MNKPEHVLLICLGPVQDFIAQARRTRDLWFGSHLLSELSKAAARGIVTALNESVKPEAALEALIFPAITENTDLTYWRAPIREGLPAFNAANKLVALLPQGVDPETVAAAARASMRSVWFEEIVPNAKQKCKGVLREGSDALWQEQISSVLEFQALWTAVDEEGYGAARTRVEEALGARKTLRTFAQWQQEKAGVPKSSLDGGRSSVLAEGGSGRTKRCEKRWRLLRIGVNEQLDAVGLIKRAGGEPEQFVPIYNIAAAAWLQRMRKRCDRDQTLQLKKKLEELVAAYRELQELPTNKVQIQRDFAWVKDFPFDAHIFREERWPAIYAEFNQEPREHARAGAQSWGAQYVQPLLQALKRDEPTLGEPTPYVACLVADGDHMGTCLQGLDKAKARAVSKKLSSFAAEARRIIEGGKLRGVLVYAGGDDVLAFVCAEDALECAEELRTCFAKIMKEAFKGFEPTGGTPTLSVGIGIGHTLDSMGSLLALGRKAEKLAKGDTFGQRRRNALAVILDKRSGGQTQWRARWDDEWDNPEEGAARQGPVARVKHDIALLERAEQKSTAHDRRLALSSKKIFEVAEDLRRLPSPRLPSPHLPPGTQAAPVDLDVYTSVLRLDILRTLSRSHHGASSPDEDAAQVEDSTGSAERLLREFGLRFTMKKPSESSTADEASRGPSYREVHDEVDGWVQRLLIAKLLKQVRVAEPGDADDLRGGE